LYKNPTRANNVIIISMFITDNLTARIILTLSFAELPLAASIVAAIVLVLLAADI